ncbi:MAG: hypothetical protein AAFP78_11370 [Pseudomonadota bacterium]
MAEQKVVPMNEEVAEDGEDAKKTATARCLSELVSVTMSKAAARLSSVDEDPIYREATVRAGIRDFSRALRQHFPDLRDALPDYLTAAANELTGGPGHGQPKTTARQPGATAGGARSYAEHQRSAGKPGG